MGVDFIEKTERTLERDWTKRTGHLLEPTLFPTDKQRKPRLYRLHPLGANGFSDGETLTLRKVGERVLAYRGGDSGEAGEIVSPPRALLRALDDACGVAVAVVERVLPYSGHAEVSLL